MLLNTQEERNFIFLRKYGIIERFSSFTPINWSIEVLYEKWLLLLSQFEGQEWYALDRHLSVYNLRSGLMPERHSCLFGSLVFSLSGKNKRKPCWSFKLQRCILPFSRTSSEEVQTLLKGCLLLLIFDIFWYTQLPKTMLGYWDLLGLHLQARRLKSGFAKISGHPVLLVEDSGRVLLSITCSTKQCGLDL